MATQELGTVACVGRKAFSRSDIANVRAATSKHEGYMNANG